MSAKPVPFPLEREFRTNYGRGELTLGVREGDVRVLRSEVYGVPQHGWRTEVWLWRRDPLWRLAVATVDELGRLTTYREGWYDTETRALWSHGEEVSAARATYDRLNPGAAVAEAEAAEWREQLAEWRREADE